MVQTYEFGLSELVRSHGHEDRGGLAEVGARHLLVGRLGAGRVVPDAGGRVPVREADPLGGQPVRRPARCQLPSWCSRSTASSRADRSGLPEGPGGISGLELRRWRCVSLTLGRHHERRTRTHVRHDPARTFAGSRSRRRSGGLGGSPAVALPGRPRRWRTGIRRLAAVGPAARSDPRQRTASCGPSCARLDPARIEANVRRLASFGTRHTLSSQDDPVPRHRCRTRLDRRRDDGVRRVVRRPDDGRRPVVRPAARRRPDPGTDHDQQRPGDA